MDEDASLTQLSQAWFNITVVRYEKNVQSSQSSKTVHKVLLLQLLMQAPFIHVCNLISSRAETRSKMLITFSKKWQINMEVVYYSSMAKQSAIYRWENMKMQRVYYRKHWIR